MRDFSLGVVRPLLASLRILLHVLALSGVCVCWVPISAHSITELQAPTSLSLFPVDLRTWTLRNSRRIANRDLRLKALISLISQESTSIRRALPRAVPQCGQRWKDLRLCAYWHRRKNAVMSVWPIDVHSATNDNVSPAGNWHACVRLCISARVVPHISRKRSR